MRKILKRFHDKDRTGIISGKVSSVKYDKCCLIDVKIFNCHRPEKVIAGFPHLWLDTRDVDQHYDYENNIVMFKFKAYKYLRANGSEDYSVMSI